MEKERLEWKISCRLTGKEKFAKAVRAEWDYGDGHLVSVPQQIGQARSDSAGLVLIGSAIEVATGDLE